MRPDTRDDTLTDWFYADYLAAVGRFKENPNRITGGDVIATYRPLYMAAHGTRLGLEAMEQKLADSMAELLRHVGAI